MGREREPANAALVDVAEAADDEDDDDGGPRAEEQGTLIDVDSEIVKLCRPHVVKHQKCKANRARLAEKMDECLKRLKEIAREKELLPIDGEIRFWVNGELVVITPQEELVKIVRPKKKKKPVNGS
jgi:hypothetical protein